MARSVLKNFLNTQSTASRFKGIEIWKLPPFSLKIFKTAVLWFFFGKFRIDYWYAKI